MWVPKALDRLQLINKFHPGSKAKGSKRIEAKTTRSLGIELTRGSVSLTVITGLHSETDTFFSFQLTSESVCTTWKQTVAGKGLDNSVLRSSRRLAINKMMLFPKPLLLSLLSVVLVCIYFTYAAASMNPTNPTEPHTSRVMENN